MQENEKIKFKKDFRTPSEILENYPQIKNIYTPQMLGYLVLCKVVTGKKLKRGCYISESDFLDFMKWRFGFNPE